MFLDKKEAALPHDKITKLQQLFPATILRVVDGD
jgi:hypothetical protein